VCRRGGEARFSPDSTCLSGNEREGASKGRKTGTLPSTVRLLTGDPKRLCRSFPCASNDDPQTRISKIKRGDSGVKGTREGTFLGY